MGKRGEPVTAIAFPFGQASADDLLSLALAAGAAGILAIAPAPERRLLFAGTADAVAAVRLAAGRLGFVVEPDDPRRFISACIGSAGCASGGFASREVAAGIAGAAAELFDGSFRLHVSGCAKGCAHPEPATMTLAGIDKGVAIVLEGRARDEAAGFASASGLVEGAGRLARALRDERRAGETVRSALQRLGRGAAARMRIDRPPIGTEEDGPTGYGGKPRLSA